MIRMMRLQGPDGGKPFIYVYTCSGKLISKFLVCALLSGIEQCLLGSHLHPSEFLPCVLTVGCEENGIADTYGVDRSRGTPLCDRVRVCVCVPTSLIT